MIARHCAAQAVRSGHSVVALLGEKTPAALREQLAALGPQLTLVSPDRDWATAIRGCDVLIDTQLRAPELGSNLAFHRASDRAAERMLSEACSAGIPRVVLVSSLAVHRFDGSIDVDPRSRPRDRRHLRYALNLQEAEELVLAQTDLEGVVVRPGLWTLGVGDPIVHALARALRAGRLPLIGDGKGVLNIAHAADVATGVLKAAEQPGVGGQVYAIANPELHTWREVLTTLASLLGGPPPRRLRPTAPTQAVASVLERAYGIARPEREPMLTRYRTALLGSGLHVRVDAAITELDWAPQTPWRETLRQVAVDALRELGIHPRGRT
jgi:nucleoside-diphosphate-sugar epimerase